jgi:hypothetical protein
LSFPRRRESRTDKRQENMNKSSIAVIIILGVVLIGVGVFCFTLIQDKSALAAELNSTQTGLASTKAELDTTACTLLLTQQELGVTRAELDTARGTLTSTRAELGTAKEKLASAQSELVTTNQTLASKLVELSTAGTQLTTAQKSLATLQDSITGMQQKLTSAQDTLRGLGITVAASSECWDVNLVDNVTARNPTWNQLVAFLAKDKTENHAYIANVYDCSQFSRDIHNNAEAAGIRAAEVQVGFRGEKVGHALNAFITTDYGLVYIDSTESPDRIARVKKEKEYRGINLDWASGINARNDSWFESQPVYYYLPGSSGSPMITSAMEIYW